MTIQYFNRTFVPWTTMCFFTVPYAMRDVFLQIPQKHVPLPGIPATTCTRTLEFFVQAHRKGRRGFYHAARHWPQNGPAVGVALA